MKEVKKNRDLMVVNLVSGLKPKALKKIRKKFQKEYSDYYVVVSSGLKNCQVLIEITQINK